MQTRSSDENSVRLSLSLSFRRPSVCLCDFKRKLAVLRFEPAFEGGLGSTYSDHLRLIGKCVVDFLLVLIELFRKVLRLRRYERISVQNRRFRSNRGRLSQNFRCKWSSPTNHSSYQKTRLNVLSYGITRCSAIAERPRCRVRYSFRKK